MSLRTLFHSKSWLRAEAARLHEGLRKNDGDVLADIIKLEKIYEAILKMDLHSLRNEPVNLSPTEYKDGVYAAVNNNKFIALRLFIAFYARNEVDADKLDDLCDKNVVDAIDLRNYLSFRKKKTEFSSRIVNCFSELRKEMGKFEFEKEMTFYHKECGKRCSDVLEYKPDEVIKLKKLTSDTGDTDASLFRALKKVLNFLDHAMRKPANTDGYLTNIDANGSKTYSKVDMLEFYERYFQKLHGLRFECQPVEAPKAVVGL